VSDILIDREILRSLVEKYFLHKAQATAYRAVFARISLDIPELAATYGAAQEGELARQLEETKGLRSLLEDAFDSKADDKVRVLLRSQFPLR